VFILEDSAKLGGIVVTKNLAKLIFGIAALVATTWFGTSSSRAYGDAPWCSVITLSGDVYWNCQYRTVEECARDETIKPRRCSLQLADRQMGMGRADEGFEILSARPPPWSVEEQAACFVVRDNNGQFTGVAYASSI
jgi:hypothetical protein